MHYALHAAGRPLTYGDNPPIQDRIVQRYDSLPGLGGYRHAYLPMAQGTAVECIPADFHLIDYAKRSEYSSHQGVCGIKAYVRDADGHKDHLVG